MFGKPEWFGRRKYSGWGLAPKTWQGWIYILALAVPLMLASAYLEGQTRIYAIAGWAIIVGFDVLDTMAKLEKDERETLHEAIAERNAAWAMVLVLAAGMLYQAMGAAASAGGIDPVLLLALLGGVLAKGITNWKLGAEN